MQITFLICALIRQKAVGALHNIGLLFSYSLCVILKINIVKCNIKQNILRKRTEGYSLNFRCQTVRCLILVTLLSMVQVSLPFSSQMAKPYAPKSRI